MIRHRTMKVMLARRDRLAPEEEARVAAHLEHCLECRALAREYAAQVALLRSFRREAPPSGLRGNLVAQIVRREGYSPRHQESWVQHQARRMVRRPSGVARRARVALFSSRWPAVLVAPILALALIIVGTALNGPTPHEARAAALLQSAARARLTMPYSSTAIMRYQATDTTLFPQWQVLHVVKVRAAVRDAQHYRIETTVVEPALESGTLTTVQDGSRYTQYDTRTETAGRRVVHEPMNDVSLPLAGSGGWGPAPLFDPAQSIHQYLGFISGNPALQHVPHYARIVAHARLLGRTVTEVAYAPVEIGTRCVGTTPTAQSCDVPADSGSARVWIDDKTHLILKYTIDMLHSSFLPGRYAYQVTSLKFGPAASRPTLNSHLPVRAGTPQYGKSTIEGRGTVFPHTVPVPPGFLQPALPPGIAYASTDMNYVRTPPLNRIAGLDIEFSQQKPHISISPAYHHFVLVQERLRVHGLPSSMQTGKRSRAGGCTVWTGKTMSGMRTIAFARGAISILATTDTLSSDELVAYVAHTVCRSSHVSH